MSASGTKRDEDAPPRADGDAELVSRAAAGDRTAYRALYDRHRPAVFRVARAFASFDRDDVEDIVQESFVRAFGGIASLRTPARFGPWLLAIARNRALSRIAHFQAGDRMSAVLEREMELLAEQAAGQPEPELQPEVEVVRRVIAELPDGAEKETVRLFYLEGQLSAREIAARLGVGKSAITMRLERFRAKVKRRVLAEVARLRGRES